MRQALWLLGLCVLLGGCRSLQVPVGALVQPQAVSWAVPPPLVVHWRRDVEAAPSRALVAGRILLVTNRKGDVHAFELPEGRRLGVLDVGRDLIGTPALQAPLLLMPVAVGDAAVVAYDLYRRRAVWHRKGDGVEGGLALDSDVVYVAARWGSVCALDVRDGRERWVQEPEANGLEGVRARPLRVGELLVVADKRGRVVALEAASGRLRWQRQLWPVYADPAVADGLLLVPTTRGHLVALEAASGATAWRLTLADTSVHLTRPVIAGPTVYVAGSDGTVRALARSTGAVRWTWTGGAAIVAIPVADTTAGVLYVGDLHGRLVALSLNAGHLLWETRLEGGVLDLAASPFGLIVLTRPRHVYLLQSDRETVALRP